MGRVFIGTSGFSYSHWREKFYPLGLPQSRWLEFYAKNFSTLEVNASFYHLMRREVFLKWQKAVGKDFVFSFKGNRFITHIKRLKGCREGVENFLGAIKESLAGGVILWQLPPTMASDPERLEAFILMVNASFEKVSKKRDKRSLRQAFEFRHKSWLTDEIFNLLKRHQCATVIQDYPGWPMTERITADFVYLRFHGKDDLYSANYRGSELRRWGEKIIGWRKEHDIYAYFNNDALGYAVENAMTLKKIINC